MNPRIVGKSARQIADMAGIRIPAGTRVLLSRQTAVGKHIPYSREKLCPILAFYVEEGWEEACRRSIEILNNEGIGHTMVIHSENEQVIREFALQKPVSRLLVNTPGALGGVGASTNLPPALTLGCGSVGGSATSDNVGPLNLINIRRVAWACGNWRICGQISAVCSRQFCRNLQPAAGQRKNQNRPAGHSRSIRRILSGSLPQ